MAGRLLSRRCENRGRRDAEEDQINMSGPSNRASVLREKFTLVADRCNEVYRQDLKQPVKFDLRLLRSFSLVELTI